MRLATVLPCLRSFEDDVDLIFGVILGMLMDGL